jgi:hypothetical protein
VYSRVSERVSSRLFSSAMVGRPRDRSSAPPLASSALELQPQPFLDRRDHTLDLMGGKVRYGHCRTTGKAAPSNPGRCGFNRLRKRHVATLSIQLTEFKVCSHPQLVIPSEPVFPTTQLFPTTRCARKPPEARGCHQPRQEIRARGGTCSIPFPATTEKDLAFSAASKDPPVVGLCREFPRNSLALIDFTGSPGCGPPIHCGRDLKTTQLRLGTLAERKFVTLGVAPALCRCLIDGAGTRRLINVCSACRSSPVQPAAILQVPLHRCFRGEETCEVNEEDRSLAAHRQL